MCSITIVNADFTAPTTGYFDVVFNMQDTTGQPFKLDTRTNKVTWVVVKLKDSTPIVTHSTSDNSVVIVPSMTSPTISSTFVVHMTPNDVQTLQNAATSAGLTHYATISTPTKAYKTTVGNVIVSGVPPTPTATSITISAPDTVRGYMAFSITAQLKVGSMGTGVTLASKTLSFQRSTNNATFAQVATKNTDSTGKAVLSWKENRPAKYYYRVVFAGDTIYAASTSKPIVVQIRR